jgi:[histone H3]-lysine36 N-dimethyltransferase SETMAR
LLLLLTVLIISNFEFKMNKSQIHLILLYEFKLGNKAAEAARNINRAWGPLTTNERTAQRWFARFRSGDTSLEEEEGRGRSPSIDDDHLKALVEENPRTTLCELAIALNVHYSTVSLHLQAIGKVKKLDSWVPHALNEKQQMRRMEVASSLLLRHKECSFLDRIFTCDEKWIMYNNMRRGGQWLDADELPGHFPKPDLHPKKVMITVWWNQTGIIHYSFLETGKTITAASYSREIDQCYKKLAIKCPNVVNRKGPILLHDNARPHVGKVTQKKLSSLGIEVLPHPPYSPDLSPTDYHMFRHLDNFLCGKIFDDRKDIENAVHDFFNSQKPEFYRVGIEKLTERWQKCVNADGNYFD